MYPSKPSCLPKKVKCKRCYKKGNGNQGKSFSKLTSVTYYYNLKTGHAVDASRQDAPYPGLSGDGKYSAQDGTTALTCSTP